MVGELERLFRLKGLDEALVVKEQDLARFENDLRQRRDSVEACNARIAEQEAVRKELVGQRALAERRLSDGQSLLKDRRSRVSRITTERELRAGESEIASIAEEIDGAEEGLLLLMEKVEDAEKVIAGFRTELADLEAADHRQLEEESSRIDALRATIAEEQGERDVLAAELPGPVKKRYEQVRSRRGGQAVVEVQQGSCGGCHMRVPPQTLIEIMKTGVIRVCPSCQRILYVESPAA